MLRKQVKALLIEDDRDIVILLNEILQKSGFSNFDLKISETLSGGISLLKTRSFDVLILDLNLPDSQGLNTLLSIREISNTIPVVILTADEDMETAFMSIKQGADDFLIKGDFSLNLLERSIRYSIERRKNHIELKNSRERFANIIKGIADWVWETDKSWKVKFITGNFKEITGYGKKELLGESLFLTMTKDDKEFARNLCNIFAKQKKAINDLNTWNYTKNGREICLLMNAIPFFDEAGNFSGYRGISKDVTQIKNMDYLLYQKIEEQKALLSSIPNYVYLKNEELYYVTANKAFADFIGMSESLLEGKTDFDLFDKIEAQKNYNMDKRVIDEGVFIFNHETKVIDKHGNEMWHLMSKVPYFNEEGKVIGMVGASLDITSRKEAEKEILKLSRAVEQSANTIFITDLDGKIIYANNALEKTTGYSKKDILERNFEIEKFKFNPKSVYGDIFDAMAAGKEMSREIQALTKSGEYKWFTIMITPVKDSNEKITNYIVILVDISKRKTLEQEREKFLEDLKNANERLKELSDMKDDFVAVASHDLRSPFTAILGYTEFLLRDTKLNSEQEKMIEHIRRSASTQLNYVNDILDIIKIESGQIKLKIDTYLLKPLINESSMFLEMLCRKKNIKMKTEIETNVKINIDYPKILQVMNNLISNAIKFTPSGGEIVIRAFQNKFKEIEIHVIDNGIGIPEEKIPTLFTRYKQHHTSGTEGEKGTGLGLAICKNLVELHGGKINVKSQENKGSDFYFTLPL